MALSDRTPLSERGRHHEDLKRMRQEQKDVALLMKDKGYSNAAIARILHIPENYVRAFVAPKIKEVRFQDSERRYGNKEAIATMEDGTEEFAICWFDDELRFNEREFIGLTIEEARDLKQARDIAYLQS